MAGHVMNFSGACAGQKELISQGVTGDILYCMQPAMPGKAQGHRETWKKTRLKSGGHLYHHIHELDCVQFLMGGCPDTVTMAGGNVAHQGTITEMRTICCLSPWVSGESVCTFLEYGSAFHWQEHYLLIQEQGRNQDRYVLSRHDIKTEEGEEHFLVHRTKERG